ncbi:hypothetical protein BV898_05273 [Hypsibius exemplaris]|uniref:C2H2-type domain-containing protein n=1 Tax=Hypsibius exemplaris TaxID=2072580 RepID=A0A1W0WZQ4_HYPEX|nr:hypothetical protein BV898_05273 [Hypsibius exemplaris]
MSSSFSSQRCKIIFEASVSASARHYLLVSKEGHRFGELCAKILSDCASHLNVHNKEIASLCWKDSDDDMVNVDCEDAFIAAMSYVVPDQSGFSVLRLYAKFRPKVPTVNGHATVLHHTAARPSSNVPASRGGFIQYASILSPSPDRSGSPEMCANGARYNGHTTNDDDGESSMPIRNIVSVPKSALANLMRKRPSTSAISRNAKRSAPGMLNVGEFRCPTCCRCFPTEIQMNGHLSCHSASRTSPSPVLHLTMPSTTCTKCGVKCLSLETLSRHDCELSARKNASAKRVAERRSTMEPSMVDLKEEDEPISSAPRYTCRNCEAQCGNAERWAQHNCDETEKRRCRRVHGSIPKKLKKKSSSSGLNLKKAICGHCKRHFKNIHALSAHMRFHKKDVVPDVVADEAEPEDAGRETKPSFVCVPACGKWYAHKGSLNKHRRTCKIAKTSAATNGSVADEQNGSVAEEEQNVCSGSEEGPAWDSDQLGGGVVSTAGETENSHNGGGRDSSPEIEVSSRPTSSPASSFNAVAEDATGTHYEVVLPNGPYGGPCKVEVPFSMVDW